MTSQTEIGTCNTYTESVFITMFLVYILCMHVTHLKINKKMFALGYFGNVIALIYGYFLDENIDKLSILGGYLFEGFHVLLISGYGFNKCTEDRSTHEQVIGNTVFIIATSITAYISYKTYMKIKTEHAPLLPTA